MIVILLMLKYELHLGINGLNITMCNDVCDMIVQIFIHSIFVSFYRLNVDYY